VPLKEDWQNYVTREVTPFVPDAWVDESYRDGSDREIGRVGYEINFNRYFYKYVPPRPLAEIDEELKTLEAEIAGLLKEVAA
jgi:type I restriction enzyme M protein